MDAEKYFKEAFARGRLHHTILVEEGDEKTILLFAQLLFCGGCKKGLDEFSEIVRITPSGSSIKIFQIRELEELVALKPFSSPWRLVVFEEAEKMTVEAVNALLKLLEEPPEATYFLILTDSPSSLPPTILSRSVQLSWKGKLKRKKKKLPQPEGIKKREDLKRYIEDVICFLRDWEAVKYGNEPLYFSPEELNKVALKENKIINAFDDLVKIYSISDRSNLSISKKFIKNVLEGLGIV